MTKYNVYIFYQWYRHLWYASDSPGKLLNIHTDNYLTWLKMSLKDMCIFKKF